MQYFNKRFPSKEWSGPAWYSCKTDKQGFPKSFRLEHFHPLDLGHGTATEWEARDLAKVLKQTYESMPKLKKCFLGLIHSHHSMGAFFSGTDSSTLENMAPDKGFYCSLVVATNKEPYAFAFAYKDQYGHAHVYEVDSSDIITAQGKAQNDWVEVADLIEKEAKPTTIGFNKVGSNQLSLVSNDYRPGYGYHGNYEPYDPNRKSEQYSDDEKKIVEELLQDMEEEKISWYEFREAMEGQGLDAFEYFDKRPNNWASVYGYGGY